MGRQQSALVVGAADGCARPLRVTTGPPGRVFGADEKAPRILVGGACASFVFEGAVDAHGKAGGRRLQRRRPAAYGAPRSTQRRRPTQHAIQRSKWPATHRLHSRRRGGVYKRLCSPALGRCELAMVLSGCFAVIYWFRRCWRLYPGPAESLSPMSNQKGVAPAISSLLPPPPMGECGAALPGL